MKSFFSGRKEYVITHILLEDVHNRKKGTEVSLLGSRKESDGHWTCMVASAKPDPGSRSSQFVVNFDQLKKIS